MNQEIVIEKASAASTVGATLNSMAVGDMVEIMTGSTDKTVIESTMIALWQGSNNRFSHEFAYEAKMGKKTLGMMTCYPVTVMDKLAIPTAKQILHIRGMAMVSYALKHPRSIYALLTMEEGKKDEFHVGSIALLPESRGLGIGKQLLQKAETLAKEASFSKISLTVREDNPKARQLYERIGYRRVGHIARGPLSLYRMMKPLSKGEIQHGEA